jgi:hypothetical protein
MNESEKKDVVYRTDVHTKDEPPPRGIDMNEAESMDILLLTDVHTKDEPPPRTDMFFSESAQLRANLLDTVKLGIAIGLASGIMFVIISLVALISNGGTGLGLFDCIFPGYSPTALLGIIIGVVWSVVYGFFFGIIVGILYNSVVRENVINRENWETYA